MLATTVQLTSCKTVKMKDADEKYERGEYYAAAETYRKIYNKLRRKEDRYQRGEVAYMLGISDHSYFIRLFRKMAGITPQEYRRQLKV